MLPYHIFLSDKKERGHHSETQNQKTTQEIQLESKGILFLI